MKSLIIATFMLFFALQTGWAQVHAAQDQIHTVAHVVHDDHAAQSDASGVDDHCPESHCNHGLGLVRLVEPAAPAASDALVIAALPQQRARLLFPDIERPKWALTTLAVVSH